MSEKSKFDMFGLWIHVQYLLFLSLLGLGITSGYKH